MRGAARSAVESAAVFTVCAAAFFAALGLLGTSVADVDALYHYQVASLIRTAGPWIDISWLPFTVLGARGPDHHWLFHLLVAPLTAIGHDQLGLNVACAVVAAAVPAAILPFLRRAGVPFAALFALAIMFASEALPFRFLGLRAQALALVFTVAAMFAMSWRKPLWVGVVAFLFTEAYHGAVILACVLTVTLAVQWAYERRITFTLVTATAVGVFAGLAASPWFPRNIAYLIFHTLFKTGSEDAFLVGGEWLPPPVGFLLHVDAVAHLAWASGLIAILASRGSAHRPRIAQDTAVACLLTAIFLAMNVSAWRFVEYYAPFAVVAAALLWRDAGRQRPQAPWLRTAPAALLVAALAWGVPRGIEGLRQAKDLHPFGAFADFMRYIDAHDPHPMVFDTYWADFQAMVFWSTRARYAAGLDGNYLRYGDPARFRVWYAFARGLELERHDHAREIARAFRARWIVVNAGQPALARNLLQDRDAQLVMAREDSGWLFEVKPAAE